MRSATNASETRSMRKLTRLPVRRATRCASVTRWPSHSAKDDGRELRRVVYAARISLALLSFHTRRGTPCGGAPCVLGGLLDVDVDRLAGDGGFEAVPGRTRIG